MKPQRVRLGQSGRTVIDRGYIGYPGNSRKKTPPHNSGPVPTTAKLSPLFAIPPFPKKSTKAKCGAATFCLRTNFSCQIFFENSPPFFATSKRRNSPMSLVPAQQKKILRQKCGTATFCLSTNLLSSNHFSKNSPPFLCDPISTTRSPF